MDFLLCDDEYIRVGHIVSINPCVTDSNYSVIHTSDGREHIFRMKADILVDEIGKKCNG